MSYIYYIWKKDTDSYIGQDSGSTEDLNRLKDHIEHAYLKNGAFYGSEKLIAENSCSQVIFGYLKRNENGIYGIPESIFNQFLERWTDSGSQLSERDYLNAAEILHIIGRKASGQDLSSANISIGGTFLKEDMRFRYHLTEAEKQAVENLISALENDEDGDFKDYDFVKFRQRFDQIELSGFNKLEHWDKVVYPTVYRALEDISKHISTAMHNKILDVILQKILKSDLLEEIAADTISGKETKELVTKYAEKLVKRTQVDAALAEVKKKLKKYITLVGETFGVAIVNFEKGEGEEALNNTCKDIVYNVISALRTRFRVNAVHDYIQKHFDELKKGNGDANQIFRKFVKSTGGDFLPSSKDISVNISSGKNLFNVQLISKSSSQPNWMEGLKELFGKPISSLITKNTLTDLELRDQIKEFSLNCFQKWYDAVNKVNIAQVALSQDPTSSWYLYNGDIPDRPNMKVHVLREAKLPLLLISNSDSLLERVKAEASKTLGSSSYLIKHWNAYYRGCVSKITKKYYSLEIGKNSEFEKYIANNPVQGWKDNQNFLQVTHSDAVYCYVLQKDIGIKFESDTIY